MASPEMRVYELWLSEYVQAYKKEGPKFMQRLVAKQKAWVKDSCQAGKMGQSQEESPAEGPARQNQNAVKTPRD